MDVESWINALDGSGAAVREAFQSIYGVNERLVARKIALYRKGLDAFGRRFGNVDVRIFRSPGRINLRGMHVDTHGGYLNLVTHHREVIVVASMSGSDEFIFENADPKFPEFVFRCSALPGHEALRKEWEEVISRRDVRDWTSEGGWRNYLAGAALSLQRRRLGESLAGVRAVVASDLPQGAGLSSSGALCVAVLLTISALNGDELDPVDAIKLVQQAEWYAGARTGTSDQGAMLFGGREKMVSGVLYPRDLRADEIATQDFPGLLDVIVVNSRVVRSLSGGQKGAYAANRFAYSLALEIIRQELEGQGVRLGTVESVDRLSRLSPHRLDGAAGRKLLFDLIARLPHEIDVEQLGLVYDLPYLDATYDFYFGHLPEGDRPTKVHLRGPILFGIAESERARVFPGCLANGEYEMAGTLMNIGHNGDRVIRDDGQTYQYDISDEALAKVVKSALPIYRCPGVYGASVPAMDVLVDASNAAGALGASLTGGGMGGSVVALCRKEQTDTVMGALRRLMSMEAYGLLAGQGGALDTATANASVRRNISVAGAGEFTL